MIRRLILLPVATLVLISAGGCVGEIGDPGSAGTLGYRGGLAAAPVQPGQEAVLLSVGDGDGDGDAGVGADRGLGNAATPTVAATVGQEAANALANASQVPPSAIAAPVLSGPACAIVSGRSGGPNRWAGVGMLLLAALFARARRRRRASADRPRGGRGRAPGWGAPLLVVLLTTSAPAQAADVQKAKEHFKSGATAYDLGRYDEAIKEFEAAYQSKSDPALLFNIAQAHRLMGHADEALRTYRAYLRKSPRAVNRDYVEARIKNLQDVGLNDTVLRPGEGGRLDDSGAPLDIQPLAADDVPLPLTDGESVRPWTTRRLTGVVTAGVGVAAIVAGAAWRISAANDGNIVTQAGRNGQRFDQNLQYVERHGMRNHTLGTVSIGLGGAALVTGALLYLLGPQMREGAHDAIAFQGATVTDHGGAVRFAF